MLLAILLLGAARAAAPSSASFFLSPAGSDANDGLSSVTPFATLPRAQAAVQSLRSPHGELPGPVLITLLQGVYSLAETAALNASISGDSQRAVTLVAEAGAILSGGAPVTGWTQLASDLFQAHLPLYLFPQQLVSQLWGADGSRRLLQETPILQYANLTVNTPTNPFTYVSLPPGQLNATAAQLAQARIVLYHSWTSSVNEIASYNPANSTITIAGGPADHYNTATLNRYVLRNIHDVDRLTPGSFIFDAVSRNLTYRAMAGEDPRLFGQQLIAPRMATVLSLAADAAAGEWISNVHLVNISVAHTAALLEEQCMGAGNGCSAQSGADLTTAAVEFSGVANSTITGCEIAHTGGYALWLHEESIGVQVSFCHLYDLGAGGVRIGRNAGGVSPDPALEASAIVLTDSIIEDGGHILEAGCGVLLQLAHNVSVIHNSIHDLYYTGVLLGWTWDYSPTSNGNNTVAFNSIFNIGRGRLSDMGCVYHLGRSPGSVIDHNVCTNVVAAGYGGWGLYTDQASEGVVLSNNIVYNSKSAGFHQHFGLNNVIINNVFAFPGDCAQSDGCDCAAVRSSQHAVNPSDPGMYSSFAFTRNIVLLGAPNTTFYYTTVPYGLNNMTIDGNVYWNLGDTNATHYTFGPTQVPVAWAAWQAEGKDEHSLVADPQFLNAEGFDFSHLLPTSPALTLGFQPIDTSSVGPRPRSQVMGL